MNDYGRSHKTIVPFLYFCHKIHVMRKTLFLLLTILVMASCSDPNAKYVKKAVRIMDQHGIFALGPEWEKAKQEALSAKPSSL